MTIVAATPTYTAGAYRPPQWNTSTATVAVTQTPPQNQSVGSQVDANGVLSVTGSTPVTYVFDAVLLLDHEQRLEKTQHPVQTSASISSHAYLMPARVVLDIGMSDALASYSTSTGLGTLSPNGSYAPSNVAPFTGYPSKSVSAYQTMLSLQSARQPLTVTTRLRTYTNMVITSVAPQETAKTITGLRMRVEFEQIFTAVTTSTPVSARPDTTQDTNVGTVNPSAVPTATENQFSVTPKSVSTATVTNPLTSSSQLSPALRGGAGGYANPLPMVNISGAGLFASKPGQQAIP